MAKAPSRARGAAPRKSRAPSKKAVPKKTAPKKAASKRKSPAKKAAATSTVKRRARKWSAEVMQRSDAMDLESGVFKLRSARAIAASLKKSAEGSARRKSGPFQSAMSMLNFEINRAGKNLNAERRRTLDRAKDELRKAFGRVESPR